MRLKDSPYAAAFSTLLPLRQSAVGPDYHQQEMLRMRPIVDGQNVLFLGRDNFVSWELIGSEVYAPITNPPAASLPDLEGAPHAYHLMPSSASKAAAVEVHMRARGLYASDCIAVGDSREDVDIAPLVGRFFLVANGAAKDPSLSARPNVEVTEGRNGEGFYEAVVRSLAEARAA